MGARVTIALSSALLGMMLVVSPAEAQVRGGMHVGMRGAPAGQAGRVTRGPTVTIRGTGRVGRARAGHMRRGARGEGAFFWPYIYEQGLEAEPAAPETPPVQVVVVKPPEPKAPPKPPPASLLLVNRDGKWVRVPTGDQVSDGPLAVQPESGQAASAAAGGTQTAMREAPLPSAVLVFRDGRREEVRRYVIRGDMIYVNENFWSTGSWTKKIPISELDVAATLRVNAERGSKFALPSGPNEVVIGF